MHDRAEMPRTDPLEVARRGVQLCRDGHWEGGLSQLGEAAAGSNAVQLPGVCYAYLGYATARISKQYREGLVLCEYAVKVAMCEPEAYLCLARTLMLMSKRHQALGILNRGLALAPDHPDLLDLRIDLGVRRPPVLRFLSRSNPLNQWLGRSRHRSRSV
jgi:hypothetical protein